MAFLQMHFLDTSRANRLTFKFHGRMLGSVFSIVASCLTLMCIPPQVPPAAANNQPENIPPPDRGVAEPARMQDLRVHHIDVAYQGIVDYHPQPLAVSNFHLSAARPLVDL